MSRSLISSTWKLHLNYCAPSPRSFCRCLRIFPSWMSNLRDEQSESRWLISLATCVAHSHSELRATPTQAERGERGATQGPTHNLYLLNLAITQRNLWCEYLKEGVFISIFMDGQTEGHAAGWRSGLGQSRIIFPLFLKLGAQAVAGGGEGLLMFLVRSKPPRVKFLLRAEIFNTDQTTSVYNVKMGR